jgi:hypothetical protein
MMFFGGDVWSKVVTLTVAAPFDSSSALEAQDSESKLFVRIPADLKTVDLIADAKYTFIISKLSPILEASTSDGSMRFFMVSSRVNAKAPALRGDIKGMFARNCTTTNVTGSAATIAAGSLGHTAARGQIGGESFSMFYSSTSEGM